MTHFGILCPSAIGHLNPMCVLGKELQRRSHQVTLFGIPDIRPKVMNSGLDFWTLGEAEFPTGTLEQTYKQLGEMIPVARLSVPKLRSAIKRVLSEDSYKNNAIRLQEAIRRAGGVSRAANIVEQVISTGKPVLAKTES